VLLAWPRPSQRYPLCSDFTKDPEQAQWLLHDLGISHVVSACSSLLHIAKELESYTTCRYFDIPDDNMDALMVALRRICDFLHTTIRNGGRVLVYCSSESRASVIVCAYRKLSVHLALCGQATDPRLSGSHVLPTYFLQSRRQYPPHRFVWADSPLIIQLC